MPFLHFDRGTGNRDALIYDAVSAFGAHTLYPVNFAPAIAPELPPTLGGKPQREEEKVHL